MARQESGRLIASGYQQLGAGNRFAVNSSSIMETKQYAEALKDRLSPQMFEPAPGRLMWLAVHGSIAAAGLDGECLGVR